MHIILPVEKTQVQHIIFTGTKVPLGECCVRERGMSGGHLWTTRDSHQWRRHPGLPTLSLPH